MSGNALQEHGNTAARVLSGSTEPTQSSHSASTNIILIYEAFLSFLKESYGGHVSRPSEDRMLQMTLDSYPLSMTCENAVDAIVRSPECLKTLLEFSSKLGLTNNSRLRTALRVDEERIAALLVSIFNSKSDEQAVLALKGDSAQRFLDVVQDTLDKGFLRTKEHSRMACRIIRKLSEACDMLPSSLFITEVSEQEEYPTFGGGYGDIYRASLGGRPVALKRMRQFLRGSDLRRIRLKFCREALVWKDLHHPHILPFLGIDRDSFPSGLCMVSPWMEHGTVMNYLKTHGHANVDKLLYEIAQGLQYLHSRNIVHGDLRGANILITEDWRACLADFGLSTFSDATSTRSTNRGGSLYWMAPELLDPDRFGCVFARTPATDVYAFGCVCFELYTGQPPFSNLREPAALMKVINGQRPGRPPAMSDLLWEYVRGFWEQHPGGRPMIKRVVQHMILTLLQPTSPLCISDVTEREAHPTFVGAFGHVYKASCGNKAVALKHMWHLKHTSTIRPALVQFIQDALVWKDLYHPFVLPFMGIYQEYSPFLCMVSPWMEYGNVLNYLSNHGHVKVDQLLYEIAQGLQYLHSRNIVHGNLRGTNILINEDQSACLADFGLGEFCDSAATAFPTNLYWMAPELLDPDRFGYDFGRTPASDVYAFGCVCVELYTRQPPFSSVFNVEILMKIVDGERPERPSWPAMSDALWQHVTEFWAGDPTARPTTQTVVQNMVWPPPQPRPPPQSPVSPPPESPSLQKGKWWQTKTLDTLIRIPAKVFIGQASSGPDWQRVI